MTALVVNSKRNGLPVIRALGSRGVPVIAVDHFADAVGFYSRFAQRRLVVPFVTDGEAAFVDRIARVAEQHPDCGRIVLIPTSDAHLLAFTRHWDRLEGRFLPLFETRLDVLMTCLDKTRVGALAEPLGVPVPRTRISPPPGARIGDLRLPVVVKPDIRSSPEAIAAGLFRLRVCADAASAEAAGDALAGQGFGFVVQEFIEGGDDALYTVGLVALGGRVLGHFTGRKLRQFPPLFGECAFGEVADAPAAARHAIAMIEAVGYTGVAQVEFKRRAGVDYLIEINPRVWSWVSLAAHVGVDLPWIGYRALRDGPGAPVAPVGRAGRWSYLGEDLRSDPKRDQQVGRARILWQALRADAHSIWRRDDPLPGLVQSARDLGLPTPPARRVERSS